MPIPDEWIAQYFPYGNAQLNFSVGTGAFSTDPATGNQIEESVELEYLAAVTLTPGNYTPNLGSDVTAYQFKGKLLRPRTLDPRISNGSTSFAFINGVYGRVELVFDAPQNPAYLSDINQNLVGIFRVVGGQGPPPPESVPTLSFTFEPDVFVEGVFV